MLFERKRYYHVVFTCLKCNGSSLTHCLPLRQLVENNTHSCLQQLSKLVKYVDVPCGKLAHNEYAMPYLRDIFYYVYERQPNALTYTYFNGDMLVDGSFVATVKSIAASFGNKPFLAVGRRTNVTWTTSLNWKDPSFDFSAVFREGHLFREDALDYFITSPGSIAWEEDVPDFVIGRPTFDNWLVNYAAEKGILIDATNTVRAIHQTVPQDLNHWENLPVSDNLNFNRKMAKGHFENGYTWRAQWKTKRSFSGVYLSKQKSIQKPTHPLHDSISCVLYLGLVNFLGKQIFLRCRKRRRRKLTARIHVLLRVSLFCFLFVSCYLLVFNTSLHVELRDARFNQIRNPDMKHIIYMHDIPILKKISKEYQFLYVMFVDDSFLEMTLSWLCHSPKSVLQNMAFFIPSQSMAEKLKTFGAIYVFTIRSLHRSAGAASYGQKCYYELVNERGKAIGELLRANLKVWLIESDSTWFSDPSTILQTHSNFDVIVGQDGEIHEKIPEAGFIFLNSTSRSQELWKMTMEWQTRKLLTLTEGEVGDLGNEMLQLPQLLAEAKCRWTFFPVERFVSGKWYSSPELRKKSKPVVIQNNWLIGIDKKIERVKLWGHWYLASDNKSCASH